MATFADRLKELRKEKKLTQEDLAKILIIGRSAIAMYERGQRIPRYKTIDAMADLFNVSTDYLRGKTNSRHGTLLTPEQQEEWFDKLKKKSAKEGIPVPDFIHNLSELSSYIEESKLESIIQSQRNTINSLAAMNQELKKKQELVGHGNELSNTPPSNIVKGIRIPILGRVVAGIPLEAIEDIEGWEEITPRMASGGEFFALRIRGASMEPKLVDGDIVIVRKQSTVDNGDVAIVLVNGNEATCKQVNRTPAGITLIGFNIAVYAPHFYTNDQIESLPVTIVGKVVESRHTW